MAPPTVRAVDLDEFLSFREFVEFLHLTDEVVHIRSSACLGMCNTGTVFTCRKSIGGSMHTFQLSEGLSPTRISITSLRIAKFSARPERRD